MDINSFSAQIISDDARKPHSDSNCIACAFSFGDGERFADLISDERIEDKLQKAKGAERKEELVRFLKNLAVEKGVDIEGVDWETLDVAALLAGEGIPADLFVAFQMELSPDIGLISELHGDEELELNMTPEMRKQFKDFMKHLLRGIPEEARPEVIDVPQSLMKKIMQSMKFDPENEEALEALVAADLTPGKLQKLLQKIKDGSDQGEGLLIGLVKILPPEAKKEAIFMPRAVLMPKQAAAGKKVATGEALGKPINKLSDKALGKEAGKIAGKTTDQSGHEKLLSRLTSLISNGGEDGEFTLGGKSDLDGLREKTGFERILKVFEGAQKSKGDGKGKVEIPGDMKLTGGAKAQAAKAIKPLIAILNAAGVSGDLASSFSLEGVFPEGLEWNAAAGGVQGLSLTGTAQLTSLVTQTAHAGVPHPATHMVATTIAKATTDGETKNINIRLNPPELGRIDVRMEFDQKSGSLKTHLLIEKPETYMMMQRDAHMLERALQESGFESGGADLSFELAQDGHLFNGEGEGGDNGGRSHGGASGDKDGADDSENLIEASVDWYIDPETGMTRYDMLV